MRSENETALATLRVNGRRMRKGRLLDVLACDAAVEASAAFRVCWIGDAPPAWWKTALRAAGLWPPDAWGLV